VAFNLGFSFCCPLDFLNVDDEVDYEEETNDDVPNTEEAQTLENSGWSSRTRCLLLQSHMHASMLTRIHTVL